ncbi:dTDP-4-amino-4,6-dideoxygalactose transaminase [Paenibacillus sp. 28ISP30-2]|nr:dTDP-4-amino-4,6-dideoxygalactose transaminase [Paenibacillus sp. 28ISP30-2]
MIKEGDEVIMPSYTFVSTANAFVVRGARIVFVDVRPDTMNINENLIEQAITLKTKAIVPVHYAGIACEMDAIMELAKKYNLIVIEDAAQGVMSTYKGKYLGTIGHLGCYSFHETKNYNCGEGGALVINDAQFIERAEIIREKGTNRARFFRGQVDKYSWVDIGSSYLPSEINAAFLYAQLENADLINSYRLDCWNTYFKGLKDLESKGKVDLPTVPENVMHNAHMFYLKVSDLDERTKLITYLKSRSIHTVFHYVPLHSSQAGREYGQMNGEDNFTTIESERLIRLPLYFNISLDEIKIVLKEL